MKQLNRSNPAKRPTRSRSDNLKPKTIKRPIVLSKEQLEKYEQLRRKLAEWTKDDAALTRDTWPELEKQLRLNGMSYRTRGHA